MPELLEHEHINPLTIVGDFEKSAMLWAKLNENLREIKERLTQDQLEFDIYADDPGGVTGIIGSSVGQLGGNLARQYNGPYVIRAIVATWASTESTPTTVSLKLADRTFQLNAETGLWAVTDLAIKMQKDDQILLTVTPAAACHLEIMGYAEKRRTDHT